MFSQTEEDVDACSNWPGFRPLQSEGKDGITSDGILMVVQGEDNLGDMLEPLDWGVRGEESVTNKEDKVLEWTELDCPAMAGALGVLT